MTTRPLTVEGREYVEVRDTATDGTLLVTAAAWAEHEAALRAEGRFELARELVAAEDAAEYDVLGTAYYMALSITEVRDEEKGTSDHG